MTCIVYVLLTIHVLVPSDDWPASRFARRMYTRDTPAQLACQRRRLYTHEHACAPSLTPCTGRRLSEE